VDGPVRIPKIYNGRDKMFFLISLEGLREHNPGGQQTTVPLPEQLNLKTAIDVAFRAAK